MTKLLSEDLSWLRNFLPRLPWNICSVNFNSNQYLTRQIFQKTQPTTYKQIRPPCWKEQELSYYACALTSTLPFYVTFCGPISRFSRSYFRWPADTAILWDLVTVKSQCDKSFVYGEVYFFPNPQWGIKAWKTLSPLWTKSKTLSLILGSHRA